MASLNRPIKETDLVKITECIGQNWEMLAPYLGFSSVNIDHIKSDHPQLASRVYKMLWSWCQRMGNQGTLAALFKTMHNVPLVSFDWNKLEEYFGAAIHS